jgi:hypothetical protein
VIGVFGPLSTATGGKGLVGREICVLINCVKFVVPQPLLWIIDVFVK